MHAGTLLGPYRIDTQLGSGGMGKVYAAVVEGRAPGMAVGTRVALKVVHPHLLETPGYFKRFLREAAIGQAVRHPNVVQTLDCDSVTVNGARCDFLAMEYVEGQTLRDLAVELSKVPEELCRHVGREIAKGLSAIHAAGALHRDLKPENVLITEDHVVKVMDLGVARLTDEAVRLSQTGAFIGSIHYSAPECFSAGGKHVDSRADLHALGLVLYELSCGINPYFADDVPEIVTRVLRDEPRRLGEIHPQLSPFFEEVVHTLLAKDPDDRFATADDLVAVLEEGEDSAWWHERSLAIRTETERPLRRIRIPRETSVYGREEELAALSSLFAEARSGDGRVVLLEGEAGVGKSRLVDELVRRLQESGEEFDFLFGSYPPGGAATVTGAFSTAYREHLGEQGCTMYLPENQALVRAFDALLRGEPAPPDAVALTKDSLQTCFVRITQSIAERRVVVVLIDDLHFAPGEGHALFSSLALSAPGHRVLLIGTMRPGMEKQWVSGVTRLDHATLLPVARLGPKDLMRLLEDSLRSRRLAEELGVQIAVKSDGNPFFVFEIIRGLREGNFLTQTAEGVWVTTRVIEDIQVPASVLDLVNARVSTLTEDERNLLDVASCCGYAFDPLVIGDVLGIARIPLLRQLAQIERHHRLVRSAGVEYVFDHHQVQEALYGSLSELLRREYHAALADALASRASSDGTSLEDVCGVLAVDLAQHYLKGTRPADAQRYLDAALDHLAEGYVNEHVMELAGRALAVPGLVAGERRFDLLLRRAVALEHVGRLDDERGVLDEALALATDTGDATLLARIEGRLGWYEFRLARYDDAEVHLRRGLESARDAGDRRLEADAASSIASTHWARSRFAEAREYYERSLVLAREIGYREREAASIGALGNVLSQEGRYAESLANHEQHLAIAIEIGSLSDQAIAHGNVGVALKSLGRIGEVRAHFERSLELSRQMGDRRGEIADTGNVGQFFESLGLFDEAIEHYERCLALCREGGDPRSEALVQDCVGRVWARLGEPARGRDALESALALSHEIGFRMLVGHVQWSLGQAAELAGEAREAERHCHAAVESLRDLGAEGELAIALTTLGGVLVHAGRFDAAAPYIDEALALGRTTNRPGPLVLAACHRAFLAAGDVPAALNAFTEHGARTEHVTQMEARYLLWKLTGDTTHLADAHRLLRHLVDHAPASNRAAMVEHVAVHREIAAAWAEHGTPK